MVFLGVRSWGGGSLEVHIIVNDDQESYSVREVLAESKAHKSGVGKELVVFGSCYPYRIRLYQSFFQPKQKYFLLRRYVS